MISQTQSSDETDVLLSIRSFIWQAGGRPSEWYVGVTLDPERRLFRDHGVRRDEDEWVREPTVSPEEARRVANYFLHALGTDGSAQRTMRGPAYVYAYRKAGHTNP